jgi:hypothetical protein
MRTRTRPLPGTSTVRSSRAPVVDDDKRAAILARRQRGESIRTIAAGVKVSVGVVHKTLAGAQPDTQRGAEGNPR